MRLERGPTFAVVMVAAGTLGVWMMYHGARWIQFTGILVCGPCWIVALPAFITFRTFAPNMAAAQHLRVPAILAYAAALGAFGFFLSRLLEGKKHPSRLLITIWLASITVAAFVVYQIMTTNFGH